MEKENCFWFCLSRAKSSVSLCLSYPMVIGGKLLDRAMFGMKARQMTCKRRRLVPVFDSASNRPQLGSCWVSLRAELK